MTKYGYIRKEYPESTTEQLKKMENYNYDELFIDEYSFNRREELNKLLSQMNSRDKLIVSDLRVFHCDFKSLKELLIYLQSKQIHLISINENIDTKLSSRFYSSDSFN